MLAGPQESLPRYLEGKGLAAAAAVFEAQELDADAFVTLTAADLAELGVVACLCEGGSGLSLQGPGPLTLLTPLRPAAGFADPAQQEALLAAIAELQARARPRHGGIRGAVTSFLGRAGALNGDDATA